MKDVANTQEQEHFVLQHDQPIFTCLLDGVAYHTEKMQALSEKSDKLTMNTREVMDLIKVLMLFHKLCEFPPEWLRKGWQRRALCIDFHLGLHDCCLMPVM